MPPSMPDAVHNVYFHINDSLKNVQSEKKLLTPRMPDSDSKSRFIRENYQESSCESSPDQTTTRKEEQEIIRNM